MTEPTPTADQPDPNLRWRLRLSHDTDWQKQYTGFDPTITFPKEFTDAHAMAFLQAEARFTDALLPLDHPLSFLSCYLYEKANNTHDEALESLAKRANYNTSVTETISGAISYLAQYMHDLNKTLDRKIDLKAPKPNETLVQRFAAANSTGQIQMSPLAFMEKIARRIKPQYVEGWLLYRGQTIEELRALAATTPDFPPEHKATIDAVWNAYHESGLAAQVERIRHFADSPLAQAERRIKILVDMGKPHGIIPVGTLDTGVRISSKPTDRGLGT